MKSALLLILSILLSLAGCSQGIIERSRTFEIESHNIKLKKETEFNPSKKSRTLISNDLSKMDSVSIDKAYNFLYGTEAEVFFSIKIEYPITQQFSQDSIKLVNNINLLKSDESVVLDELKFEVNNKIIQGKGLVNENNKGKIDSYFMVFDYPRIIYFTFHNVIDGDSSENDFRRNTIRNYLEHVL